MTLKINESDLNWQETNVNGFSAKPLLSMTNGTVKIVKLEPNTIFPLHHHPDKTEYGYVLSGTPEIIIDNQQYSGKSGDFFEFPIHSAHSIRNLSTAPCQLLIGAIKK